MKKTTINLGGRLIDLAEPVVMAIVNVTPDSFYETSRSTDPQRIAERVTKAVEEGATILDIGGYSSRPGAADVSPEEEYRRVSEALKVIRRLYPEMPVSLDTFRASVAERAIGEFGALIVNDISAGEMDPAMVPAVASLRVPYIAMHMRGTPATMQVMTDYTDVAGEVVRYFSVKADRLIRAGIDDVILDPGFGFAKTVRQNFELLGRLNELQVIGLPVLAGVSRKTMVWKTLAVSPSEALNGTTALHWECLRQGASILRAHDVKEAVETVKLFQAFRDANTES